jgi:Protein of unknown function (DUF3592)
MRIFPEDGEEWLAPVGKAFCIFSACMVIIGAAVFVWQFYIWHYWPSTQAIVTESTLIQTQSDEGIRMCSAAYKIQYFVGGNPYSSEKKESSNSNDCQSWQRIVDGAKGARWNVLYQRENPSNSYINPGLNFDFFFVPILCIGSAIFFTVFGLTAWKIGNFMLQHKIKML